MYSPDSEQMEPARPLGLKAELCERGANPRQGRISSRAPAKLRISGGGWSIEYNVLQSKK